MESPIESLIVDLLEWLRPGPRPYHEVLDVWRTSCPRLPVWEEANDRGYVECRFVRGEGTSVALTPRGVAALGHRHVLAS